MRVCMCQGADRPTHTYMHAYIHTYISIYIYIFICFLLWSYYPVQVWPFEGLLSGPSLFFLFLTLLLKNTIKVGVSAPVL